MWNFDIAEYDSTSNDKEGNHLFYVNVKKSTSADGQQKDVITDTGLSKVPEAVTVKAQDSISDSWEGGCPSCRDEQCKYIGLVPALKSFIEKYPKGTQIDPVEFTMEFLNVIKGD